MACRTGAAVCRGAALVRAASLAAGNRWVRGAVAGDRGSASLGCVGAGNLGAAERRSGLRMQARWRLRRTRICGLRACRGRRRATGGALAQAGIDFNALRSVPDVDVVSALVAVPGIGVWTAEIYVMFALGRADVFAPGDLALQEAARMLFGLEARPSDKVLRAMAEDWSPWRSVAARILWAYYRVAKDREGV